MPELPDLEAYARNLNNLVRGKEVTEVNVYKPEKFNVDKQKIYDALIGRGISGFARNGKEMIISFDNGNKLKIHLMLEGHFDIIEDIEKISFKSLALKIGEKYLVISDPRGWAKFELNPINSDIPDALSEDFTISYFKEKLFEKKTKNIKAFLTDQNIVRGIGNAYIDEILWEAKIFPESKSGKIPKEVVERLYDFIKYVLKRSVEEILSVNPNAINGEIRDFMRVHHKEKKFCPNGFPIKTKKIASKTTYFTEEQILY